MTRKEKHYALRMQILFAQFAGHFRRPPYIAKPDRKVIGKDGRVVHRVHSARRTEIPSPVP
jgi:hypothetical protein